MRQCALISKCAYVYLAFSPRDYLRTQAGDSILHFKDSNKVLFTRMASFHIESKALYHIVFFFFTVCCAVFDIETQSLLFAGMQHYKRSQRVTRTLFSVVIHRVSNCNCGHYNVNVGYQLFSMHFLWISNFNRILFKYFSKLICSLGNKG